MKQNFLWGHPWQAARIPPGGSKIIRHFHNLKVDDRIIQNGKEIGQYFDNINITKNINVNPNTVDTVRFVNKMIGKIKRLKKIMLPQVKFIAGGKFLLLEGGGVIKPYHEFKSKCLWKVPETTLSP